MRRLLVAALIAFGLLCSAGARAEGALSVPYANAYATNAAQKNGAVFLRIVSTGAADDALIGASAPVSEKVELHTHVREGDVMRMRAVPEIPVPAGRATVLHPAGDHIMLIGLGAPLAVATSFPLTLRFKSGLTKDVKVSVVKPGSLAAGDMEDCPHHGSAKEKEPSDAHSRH